MNFNTSCELITLSTDPTSLGTESWNGDIKFLAGDQELLYVGLHPERGNLAIKNDVFNRGTNQWGYNWVTVDYPEYDDNHERKYTFNFTESGLVLTCEGTVRKLFHFHLFSQITIS